MPPLTRAAYVSQLRRAFLLRVHPDRFRDDLVLRKQQAAVVQALAQRMEQADFAAWQQTTTATANNGNNNNRGNAAGRRSGIHFAPPSSSAHLQREGSATKQPHGFCLERRDGSFLQAQLPLHESVDAVLNAMAHALQASGAAVPKAPPNITAALDNNDEDDEAITFLRNHRATTSYATTKSTTTNEYGIDSRYDIRSRRGRCLETFLQRTFDSSDMQTLRAARTDAQAAAAAVRRLYRFAAVDATALGWSSASAAVLLRRLAAAHVEHGANLQVSSFYPLRLVFASDDDSARNVGAAASTEPRDGGDNLTNDDRIDYYDDDDDDDDPAIDVAGGILRLPPSATPLQWVQRLRRVTPSTLERVASKAARRRAREERVQGRWGVKLQPGYTCARRAYDTFLQRLCPDDDNEGNEDETESRALVLEPILATVEGSHVCRRAQVTTEGTLRLGAGMTPQEVQRAWSDYAEKARHRRVRHLAEREKIRALFSQVQVALGLSKVYRHHTASTRAVSYDDWVDCLGRLLRWAAGNSATSTTTSSGKTASNHDISEDLTTRLAGQSLGIAGSGQFCHFADDGSVVIPHDWR